MLSGYSSIVDQKSKERYANKLNYVNGIDPLALAKEEWNDNVNLWPAVTQMHTCMYGTCRYAFESQQVHDVPVVDAKSLLPE